MRFTTYNPEPRKAVAGELVTNLAAKGYDRSTMSEILAVALLDVCNNHLDPARYACTVEANRRVGWGLGVAIAQGATDKAEALRQVEAFAAVRKATAVSTMTKDIAMREAVRAHFAEQDNDEAVAS